MQLCAMRRSRLADVFEIYRKLDPRLTYSIGIPIRSFNMLLRRGCMSAEKWR